MVERKTYERKWIFIQLKKKLDIYFADILQKHKKTHLSIQYNHRFV
jgi:hypothetical protein